MERRFVVVMPVRGRHLESITSGFSRISDSGLEGKGHGLCLFPIAVFQCQRLKIVPGTGHVLFQETQITKCAEIWALSTSVAGLTYTLGQNISDKPIGLKTDGTAEKIISTYQNGNSLGIFNALEVSFVLTSAQSSRFWKIGQYFALGLGLVGIMLSGSRSIQILFLLFLIILLVQFIKRGW